MNKNIEIGSILTDNRGHEFEILQNVGNDTKSLYRIRYTQTGTEMISKADNIIRGTVRDFYFKSICGVACKGEIVCSSELQKRAFARWRAMISRCYNKNDVNYKAYGAKGVTVADRWLCFENFFEDMIKLDGYSEDLFISGQIHLDKDVKCKGNKVYSAEMCMFLDKKENIQTQPTKAREMFATNGDECYEFENISLFARRFNLKEKQIRRALSSGKSYAGFIFRYKGSVSVMRVTDWKLVVNMARFTINKEDICKEPSSLFKDRILKSEHSPIRSLMYVVELDDIPTWVSQHIARHDAFAYHTVRDGAHDTHFVGTQRVDRTGVDRNKRPQDAPCCHRIFLSAQDLITISKLRLCRLASPETRKVWEEVKAKIAKIDPELAKNMVPNCIYKNGFCGEMKPCGYCFTEAFKKDLAEYQRGSAWLEMKEKYNQKKDGNE